jgi:hypothetical protein
MGEGQLLKKVKCHILSPAFSTAGNDTHPFGRVPASMGSVWPEGKSM